MKRKPPKIVYKYRPWNLDSKGCDPLYHEHQNAKKIFNSKTIYLAHPADFNDPFDVDIISDYSLLTKEDWLIKLKQQKEYALSKGFEIAHIESQIKKKTKGIVPIWEDKQELEEFSHHHLRSLRTQSGIFSTSAHYSQPLLWSHYADNHRGIAIGFDGIALSDFLSLNHGYVHYSKDFKIPKIKPQAGTQIQDILTIYTEKSHFWRYEKEVRFFKIMEKGEERIKVIDPKIIMEVILGFNFDKNMKRRTYEYIRDQKGFDHVEFYSSHKVPNHFLFKRKPLDTEKWY